jgi:hypothetical protein
LSMAARLRASRFGMPAIHGPFIAELGEADGFAPARVRFDRAGRHKPPAWIQAFSVSNQITFAALNMDAGLE